ncbi:MAG TPA: Uma2 family endonuclease [Pedobacter sp.]|uniref:Uma2 family endonuclease n=1 Tax=Pedobacter sp. TaxID=1411316 RepID=UPI002BCCEA35|nr:Uma2 family endonuclease [Pedobacter sp.]HMI05063.1 Uma2 family endonuclease [Pedobacter sp.]
MKVNSDKEKEEGPKKVQDQETSPKSYDPEQVISTVNDIDFSGSYSYANYLNWHIQERFELIKGKIFEMTAPSTRHQECTGKIFGELYLFLKNHRCRAFIAPFDVRFPYKSKDDVDVTTVLQPDVCVVCDPTKIDQRGCIGAPDIVVEVLSPGNNRKELDNKFKIYEEFGVREYWIVHPSERSLIQYLLNEDGIFVAGKPYTSGDDLVSDLLPGFRLNIDELFMDSDDEE